jgi:glycine oxidase
MTAPLKIDVIGAGILGIWQALLLAKAGHKVRLIEASATPFADAQSRYAGAMIAPYCEAEGAEPIVREAGLEGLRLWREVYPGLVNAGTLVLAQPRDMSELKRFARLAPGYEDVSAARLTELEPAIGPRFSCGLYYPDEAHMATPAALSFLLAAVTTAGAEVVFGERRDPSASNRGGRSPPDLVVDCRGPAARDALPSLRGVRGERLLIRSRDIGLRRPVRLLHPRYPLYVVPWGDGLHLVGATVIESEDDSAMTVRSALELLGMAYALHPGFGEAEIVELSAGVRPALPDNVPRAIVRRRGAAGPAHIQVNGAHRHGFLLAPALAQAVTSYLADGRCQSRLLQIEDQ